MENRYHKNRNLYMRISDRMSKNSVLAGMLELANKGITGIVMLSYPIMLIFLLITRNPFLAKAVIVPLNGFIILSVFRILVNRPRPYEKYPVSPILKKETKGKSFPSRHVFSAAVIAMTVLFCPFEGTGISIIGIAGGCTLLFLSLVLAVIRVLTGVHFISDVIAGYLFAVFCGLVGFL